MLRICTFITRHIHQHKVHICIRFLIMQNRKVTFGYVIFTSVSLSELKQISNLGMLLLPHQLFGTQSTIIRSRPVVIDLSYVHVDPPFFWLFSVDSILSMSLFWRATEVGSCEFLRISGHSCFYNITITSIRIFPKLVFHQHTV